MTTVINVEEKLPYVPGPVDFVAAALEEAIADQNDTIRHYNKRSMWNRSARYRKLVDVLTAAGKQKNIEEALEAACEEAVLFSEMLRETVALIRDDASWNERKAREEAGETREQEVARLKAEFERQETIEAQRQVLHKAVTGAAKALTPGKGSAARKTAVK